MVVCKLGNPLGNRNEHRRDVPVAIPAFAVKGKRFRYSDKLPCTHTVTFVSMGACCERLMCFDRSGSALAYLLRPGHCSAAKMVITISFKAP